MSTLGNNYSLEVETPVSPYGKHLQVQEGDDLALVVVPPYHARGFQCESTTRAFVEFAAARGNRRVLHETHEVLGRCQRGLLAEVSPNSLISGRPLAGSPISHD